VSEHPFELSRKNSELLELARNLEPGKSDVLNFPVPLITFPQICRNLQASGKIATIKGKFDLTFSVSEVEYEDGTGWIAQ